MAWQGQTKLFRRPYMALGPDVPHPWIREKQDEEIEIP